MRIVMYLSSYVPLYLLLVVKYVADSCFGTGMSEGWTCFGNVMAVSLLVMSAATTIALKAIMRGLEAKSKEDADNPALPAFLVASTSESTSPALLNYLAVYFMPCLNMGIDNVSNCLVMFVVLVVVGFIYISERDTYLNPMLLFFGYRSCSAKVSKVFRPGTDFEEVTKPERSVILLYHGRDSLAPGYVYRGSERHDYLYLIDV